MCIARYCANAAWPLTYANTPKAPATNAVGIIAKPSSPSIEVLCAQHGEPWLVLGDMVELGSEAESIHAHMGEIARAAGVKRLFGLVSWLLMQCLHLESEVYTFNNMMN